MNAKLQSQALDAPLSLRHPDENRDPYALKEREELPTCQRIAFLVTGMGPDFHRDDEVGIVRALHLIAPGCLSWHKA
ncbi:hypothetical protein [Rhizorhabdus argentea]|uniref:hypothetical protein n=1 Tax=Rhizorhabdus argentea TaxID=1387174 RepID=UPI0030EC2E51